MPTYGLEWNHFRRVCVKRTIVARTINRRHRLARKAEGKRVCLRSDETVHQRQVEIQPISANTVILLNLKNKIEREITTRADCGQDYSRTTKRYLV
jgi:hypothetical protein